MHSECNSQLHCLHCGHHSNFLAQSISTNIFSGCYPLGNDHNIVVMHPLQKTLEQHSHLSRLKKPICDARNYSFVIAQQTQLLTLRILMESLQCLLHNL